MVVVIMVAVVVGSFVGWLGAPYRLRGCDAS